MDAIAGIGAEPPGASIETPGVVPDGERIAYHSLLKESQRRDLPGECRRFRHRQITDNDYSDWALAGLPTCTCLLQPSDIFLMDADVETSVC